MGTRPLSGPVARRRGTGLLTLLRLVGLLVALFSAMPAPLGAQDVSAPDGTIATQSDVETDAAIADRIRGILGELGGYEDVTVSVSDGIVRLRGTATSLTDIEQIDAFVSRVEGVVAIRNDVTETAEIARRLNPAIERFEARLTQLVTALPLLLIAGAVFAGIALLGVFVSRQERLWTRIAPNAFIASLYSQLVLLVFLVIGIVAGLDILNATALLGTILGAAGIVGLAVGFAVRDTVENYIASIMLSIRQPFRPNDMIEINGDLGKVIRLTSRATILLSLDGNHIRIPNAAVFKSRIVNFSRNPERRFLFEVGIDPGADIEAMRHLAEDIVAGLPFSLSEPAASVWIERLADGATILTVTGWIDQRETNLLTAKGEALRLVVRAIEATGTEVPNTTYNIDLRGLPLAGLLPSDGQVRPSSEPVAAPPADPRDPGPAEAADVSAKPDEALDRLIASERADINRPDLLRDDAPEE